MGTLSFPDGLHAYSAYSALQVPLSSSKTGFGGTSLINKILGRDTQVTALNMDLGSKWGPALQELQMLSKERDPKIFYHGLLEIGRRLEANDQEDVALQIYSSLANPESGSSPVPVDIVHRAEGRFNAIVGLGDWRKRFVHNLERLPSNALRGDTIVAMGGACLAFRGMRMFATLGLAGSFESVLALNAAATSLAFVTETVAFFGLEKFAGGMLGHPQDISPEGMFKEWARGAEMLFGLKSVGAIFAHASRCWTVGDSLLARSTRAFTPQAGMFFGILLGNKLGELSGSRAERKGDAWLIDGLTGLLDFNIANRWLHILGARAFAKFDAAEKSVVDSIASKISNPVSLMSMLDRGDWGMSPAGSNGVTLGTIMMSSRPGFGSFSRGGRVPASEPPPLMDESPSLESVLRFITADHLDTKYESMSFKMSDGVEFKLYSDDSKTQVQVDLSNASIAKALPTVLEYLDYLHPQWHQTQGLGVRGRTHFVLNDDFHRHLMEWGNDFLEKTINDFSPNFPGLLNLNQKTMKGELFSPIEQAGVSQLYSWASEDLASFNKQYGALRLIVELGSSSGLSKDNGQRRALEKIIHDISHRSEVLNVVMVSLESLQNREPLDDFFIERLKPNRGFIINEALRGGISVAMIQFPGVYDAVHSALGKPLLSGLHLTQGRSAVRALKDIVGNLLTNAWRYRSGDQPKVALQFTELSDGGLQITVQDDGIGIKAENIPRLGGDGFREARKEVEGSHGYGLGSVISNLRQLNWGPLWVKSQEGQGSQFRFIIPGLYLEAEGSSQANTVSTGAGSNSLRPINSDQLQKEEGFIAPDACFSSSVPHLKAAPKAPTDK